MHCFWLLALLCFALLCFACLLACLCCCCCAGLRVFFFFFNCNYFFFSGSNSSLKQPVCVQSSRVSYQFEKGDHDAVDAFFRTWRSLPDMQENTAQVYSEASLMIVQAPRRDGNIFFSSARRTRAQWRELSSGQVPREFAQAVGVIGIRGDSK